MGEVHDSCAYTELMAEPAIDADVLLSSCGYSGDPVRDDVRSRGDTP
jgi:hypothetical protein